jgi:hypothetical protein
MNQDQRKQTIERVCRDHGMQPESITIAARNLAKIRSMTASELEANVTELEDEVIRHLQVAQAVHMTHGIAV